MASFQTFPGLVLSGTISPSLITDPNLPPTDVIESGVPFTVGINWSVTGPAVPMMAGTWNVNVRLEAIGPGPENVYTAPAVPFIAGTLIGLTRTYTGLTGVTIPGAGPLALTVGAYSMVVLLTYLTPAGVPGPLAAVSDERIIQIFPNTPLTVP